MKRPRQEDSQSADLQRRVAELESALEQEQAERQDENAKMGFLQEKIRAVAERSKNRGSMLIKLLAALRRRESADVAVKTAKDDLEAAERELGTMLQQATAMLAEEEGKGAQGQPTQQQSAEANASKPEAGAQIAQEGASSEGWKHQGQQQPQQQEQQQQQQQDAGGPPARLPLTFKIKM